MFDILRVRLVTVRDAVGLRIGTKQEGNAPDACQAYQGVDNAANKGCLTAKDPSNDVKGKKTDAPPVQGADDSKNQSNFINDHDNASFLFLADVLFR